MDKRMEIKSKSRNLPVAMGNFSVIDSQLSRIRREFSDQMLRMDNEMNQLLSGFPSLPGSFFDENESSLIVKDGDNKALKLTFDVSQYTPEEINVETTDEKIIVHAKHEEKSKNKNVFMEYHREFAFPEGSDTGNVDISLSDDGVLVATVPLRGQLTSGTKGAIAN